MSRIIQKRQRFLVVTLGFALLIIMMGALTASAANITVTPNNLQGWNYNSNSGGGSSVITTAAPRSGDGSVEMKGDKTRWQKGTSFLTSMGLLDDVTDLAFDWMVATDSTGNLGPNYTPAFRLHIRNGSTNVELAWEGANQGTVVTKGAWVTTILTDPSQKFWRYQSGGSAGAPPYKTLSDWQNDTTAFQANAYVYGISVGVGSSVGNTYHAFADNMTLGFNNAPDTYNFEPNPACYQLTFSHTGNGANPSPNPTKSPYCGNSPANQFVEGDVVQLTAAPDPGWHVQSWSGTDNDSSLATTNSFTVGNAAQAISVAYAKDITVAFDAPGSLVCTGPVEMTIDLNDVVDLYGYQFKVSYDAAKVDAAGAFVDSWFDTSSNAFKVWPGTCTAGSCDFAVTKTNPAGPVSGSGTVAKITFSPKSPVVAGSFTAGISDLVLTDIDGFALTPVDTAGATFDFDSCGQATVSGTVSLQGRLSPIDAGTVTFHDNGNNFADSQVAFDAGTGAFSATLNVMPGGSTYTMRAHHYLYLGNEKNPLALSPGGAVSGQNTRLLGGDANNSGRPGNIYSGPGVIPGVNTDDLSCISNDFGGSAGNCGDPTNGSTDINKDTLVNVQDLSIAGGNYNKNPFLGW